MAQIKVFNGENTKAARKTCPETLWKVAQRKLDQLDSVINLDELKIPPPVIAWKLYAVAVMVNTASVLTINIAFALSGMTRVVKRLKSSIITNITHGVIHNGSHSHSSPSYPSR